MNDQNYLDYLKGISLVLLSGDGCPNCLAMKPILSNLITKYENINYYELELNENLKLFIEKYQIKSVPSILLFSNDVLIDHVHGFQPQEILEIWLDYKMDSLLKTFL